jgi:hypothetical protein
MYDIMAFFAGPIDEHGVINESLGHDVGWPVRDVAYGQQLMVQHLAQKIGEAGQRFALDHWNWENMQAYVSFQWQARSRTDPSDVQAIAGITAIARIRQSRV